MAAEWEILHAKVAKLLSRRFGKPVLKPKIPLALSDRVSNRRDKLAEASCLTQMSVLMACWKEKSFSDKECSSEIQIFYECMAKAQADRKAGIYRALRGGFLPVNTVNKLLRQYPNIKKEI